MIYGFYKTRSYTPGEQLGIRFSPQQWRRHSIAQKIYHIKSQAGLQGLTGVVLIAWVIFAESGLIKIPQSEKPDAVGQWGPLVALVLVVAGAGMENYLDLRWGRRKPNDFELETLRVNTDSATTPPPPARDSHGWPR